jgi:hypothetical protein
MANWLTFFAMSVNAQLLRFLKPASHFAMISKYAFVDVQIPVYT